MQCHILFHIQSITHGTPLCTCIRSVQTTRIIEFHAKIHTEHKEGKIQSQTYSVCQSYLFVEFIPLEHTIRLCLIIKHRPNISSIHKSRQLNNRPHFCSVFHIEVQTNISRLIIHIYPIAITFVSTWPQSTSSPSTHAIRTTCKITLLKRNGLRVAIRYCHSYVGMPYQTMTWTNDMIVRHRQVRLGKL